MADNSSRYETTTRVTKRDKRTAPGKPVAALTILWHPVLSRVGERVWLPDLSKGGQVNLSRSEPDFWRDPDGAWRPLDDSFISRRPIVLSGAGGLYRVNAADSGTQLEVDGRRMPADCVLSHADLTRGVVLTLAERVVLVMHLLEPADFERAPDLGLVGRSNAIEGLRRAIMRVTDLDVMVLLRGESGSGKELVARAVHDNSPRRHRDFVSVNMSAVPATLAAAELFGAVKGAYTGAVRDKPGLFRRADGGTLFLDEIGDTPYEVQAMLLRTLETNEIQAVGANTPRKVDARLIAATDANLEQAIADGSFRAPLMHRLAGFQITVPPLRTRRDDIGRLLVHFLREELAATGEAHHLEGRADDPWLAASVVDALARHAWPGNVRQLRNVVRQIVIASRGSKSAVIDGVVEQTLSAVSTPAEATDADQSAASSLPAPKQAEPPAPSYRRPSQVSEEELLAALRANRFQLKPTAIALGVSRTSLYDLIEKCPSIRKASQLEESEIAASRIEHGGDLDAMSMAMEVSVSGLMQRMRQLGLR